MGRTCPPTVGPDTFSSAAIAQLDANGPYVANNVYLSEDGGIDNDYVWDNPRKPLGNAFDPPGYDESASYGIVGAPFWGPGKNI